MHIEVTHESGKSCLDAVREALSGVNDGCTVVIDGMTMGDRVIELPVVVELVKVCGGTSDISVVKGKSGWNNKISIRNA